jgi:hypothetical protein
MGNIVYSGVFGGAEKSLGKGPQEENYVLVNIPKSRSR